MPEVLFPHLCPSFHPLHRQASRDKAGAYGIQGQAGMFVSGIRGDYYNVVGFPFSDFFGHVTQRVHASPRAQ